MLLVTKPVWVKNSLLKRTLIYLQNLLKRALAKVPYEIRRTGSKT